jgi:adenosylhomocysteine nucleosidase
MTLVVASSLLELSGVGSLTPSIRENLKIVPIGVGKINATLNTILAIQKYSPSLVVVVGSCGAIREGLEIGDLLFPNRVLQWDIDLERFGWPRGSLPAANGEIEGALEIQPLSENYSIYHGREVKHGLALGSGDRFLVRSEREEMGWLIDDLDLWAVDMESYGVVKAAQAAGVEVTIGRFVSDDARGRRPKNFQKMIKEASIDLFSLLAQSLIEREKLPIIL